MNITLLDKIYKVSYDLVSIDMNKVFEIIRTGETIVTDPETGKSMNLRDATEITHRTCECPERQEIKKRLLPAVTFNGEFSKVDKLHCTSYSGLTALDIDHISTQEEYDEIYKKLISIPYTAMIYQTPSGRGLKVIVKHDNTDSSKHENLYKQLMKVYGIPLIDSSCCDLARRNYICYDPNVWVRGDAQQFHFTYDPTLDTPNVQQVSSFMQQLNKMVPKTADTISDKSVMNILRGGAQKFHKEYLIEGHRRDGAYWFGTQFAKAGVDYEEGAKFVSDLYKSDLITLTNGGTFSEEECRENYTRGYDAETYSEDFRLNLGGYKNKRR